MLLLIIAAIAKAYPPGQQNSMAVKATQVPNNTKKLPNVLSETVERYVCTILFCYRLYLMPPCHNCNSPSVLGHAKQQYFFRLAAWEVLKHHSGESCSGSRKDEKRA
jgi:hypothetical protein